MHSILEGTVSASCFLAVAEIPDEETSGREGVFLLTGGGHSLSSQVSGSSLHGKQLVTLRSGSREMNAS